jgi:hypothetical protein
MTIEPLPLFFTDLEPKENNKSIYEIKYLRNMKTTFEAPRKKNDMKDVSVTGIQNHTVQNRILVTNAEANITQPSVKGIQTLQQNAPYGREITRKIIKVATYIKTYKE